MTEIIAHRGASFDAPENTLESLQLGLDQQADAIECDVRLSRDGELVVIHDASLQRVAGIKRNVSDLPLADLQALDVGSWKAAKWKDARIPTLAAAVDLIPPDRRIFIEIKVGPAALSQLKKTIEAAALPHSQIVLMEFDLETVLAMRKMFPDLEILWLLDVPPVSSPAKRRQLLGANIKIAAQHGFDGVNVQNIPQLNTELIADCGRQQLKCYCWTVDRPHRANRLFKGRINGIATNRPGWIRQQLHRRNP
ncbi:glycerophosphodiester phosphodiesterase family protein [Pontiellaceae bacterium B12219]|nr:glycerophosphodiester phosphodiesterase family protein [Pontiellaceae bacterium B12219]